MTTLEILKSNPDYESFVKDGSQVNIIFYPIFGITIVFYKIVDSFESYFIAPYKHVSLENIQQAQSFVKDALAIMKKDFR